MTLIITTLILVWLCGLAIGLLIRLRTDIIKNTSSIIKIHRKKDEKFNGKKDPIYEIKKKMAQEVGISIYIIEKYELGWHITPWSWLYPVDILTWQYILVNTINIGSEDLLKELNKYMTDQSVSLGEYMESSLKRDRDILEAQKIDENNIENILLKHNKEFSENYV